MKLSKLRLAAAAILGLVAVTACTDARMAGFGAYGDPARVTCYSGGQKIFDDFSTGKVSSEEGSDGFYFVAASTNRLVSVSGDCILDYTSQRPAGFQPVRP